MLKPSYGAEDPPIRQIFDSPELFRESFSADRAIRFSRNNYFFLLKHTRNYQNPLGHN